VAEEKRLRTNSEIRAAEVRLISEDGKQLGILSLQEALSLAREKGLDLVEVVASSRPPVCKIIDYGKLRYEQTRRERRSRKMQHQIKVKELKVGLNISEHDLGVKLQRAKTFLEKGHKVRISCMLRGREITHPEVAERLMERIVQTLDGLSIVESSPKLLGKVTSMVLAPVGEKK